MKNPLSSLLHCARIWQAKYLHGWRAALIYKKMYKKSLSIPEAEGIKDQIMRLERKLKLIHFDLYSRDKKNHGKFYYEFLPTIKLARRLKATALTLIHDEQLQFDAELIFKDNTVVNVEWVTALDHYGTVPVSSDVLDQENTKMPQYQSKNTLESIHSPEDMLKILKEKVAPLVRDSFNKKLIKQGSGAYQKNTLLGVVIDDYPFQRDDLVVLGLKEIIDEITSTPNDFVQIILLGCKSFFLKIK